MYKEQSGVFHKGERIEDLDNYAINIYNADVYSRFEKGHRVIYLNKILPGVPTPKFLLELLTVYNLKIAYIFHDDYDRNLLVTFYGVRDMTPYETDLSELIDCCDLGLTYCGMYDEQRCGYLISILEDESIDDVFDYVVHRKVDLITSCPKCGFLIIHNIDNELEEIINAGIYEDLKEKIQTLELGKDKFYIPEITIKEIEYEE